VSTPTVGFIGLGIMGKPMARNLIKAGYRLIVHDRVEAPVREIMSLGAQAPGSARQVAALSDVVITMLPDSPDVQDVVLGKDGILEALRPGTIYIDMSSISPIVTREIAPLILNGPPSVTGFAGGRPKPEEIVAYWPALIDREMVEPCVELVEV